MVMTGYFDAPGADVAALRLHNLIPTALPETTLVFCCIERLKEMKVFFWTHPNDPLLLVTHDPCRLVRLLLIQRVDKAKVVIDYVFKGLPPALWACKMLRALLPQQAHLRCSASLTM